MSNENREFRVFGPPGCGKTSEMATKYIPRAIDKYGDDKVMVTSFTKAAAREITYKRSRETGQRISVNPENVGTLHSILYHALNKPEITEVHYANEWNERYPAFAISGKIVSSVDESCSADCTKSSSGDSGDKYLNAVNIKRNKMIPIKSWSHELRKFYTIWSDFKKETSSMDFTDIIEAGLYDFDTAPCEPEVIFVDEAQDFTLLQLSVIRKWGKHAKWTVLVGDDDQTIYEFTGADPTAFLKPEVGKKYKTVLSQSYRVPEAVLKRSQALIKKVLMREEKKYNARIDRETNQPAVGEVRELSGSYQDAEYILNDLKQYLDAGLTIKLLASCAYMLEPIKKALTENAIPFHNPYRRRRRDWNPLHTSIFGDESAILNFLNCGIDEPYWNIPQLISWARHIKVGETGLKRNVGKKAIMRLKQAIDEKEKGLHTSREVINLIFEKQAVQPILERNIDWFKDNLLKTKATQLDYAIRVYKKHGNDVEVLESPPKITIGTIHSVKGAEADCVYVFPDISFQADIEMGNRNGYDSIHRLFYVAMTRAKHKLILCRPTVMMRGVTPRMFVRL